MITYNITPIPAPRMVKSDSWKKRPIVLAYWAFKDEVRLNRVQIPVPCRIIFYLPMPDSWSEKKKLSMNDRPHTQRPDLDNLCKAIFDCVLDEDGHIWNFHAEKRWAREGAIKIGSL